MTSSTFFAPPSVTSSPEDKKPNYRKLPSLQELNAQGKRILPAITWVKTPYSFQLENLDKNTLTKIAKITNAATIHCSGNCVLLATALLYNLKLGKTELAVNNTYPIYFGIEPSSAANIIFGRPLVSIRHSISKVKDLEAEILSYFNLKDERLFFIDARYTILGKNGGHCFNAIVLGAKENAKVIFVDAWKTRKHTYSVESLEKKYCNKNIYFEFKTCASPMLYLANPFVKDEQHVNSKPQQKLLPTTTSDTESVRFHTDDGIEVIHFKSTP